MRKDGNLGLTRGGWSPAGPRQLVAGATDTEKDQKLEESPVSSGKCLSQETGEPLGPVSHGERLWEQIWARSLKNK